MASKNKIIVNTITGQQIRFLQTAEDTAGKVLEMETVYQPGSLQPAAHYHPEQIEDFKVLEGELTVMINDKKRLLKEGDILHIPSDTIHAMWNESSKPARVNWQVRPAMETEFLLENTFGLAADGKVNKAGAPSLLQAAPILLRYKHVFRLAKPPYIIQQIVFNVLYPFAILAGKKSFYKKYVDL